jgi:GR25 family glycosyltransferase involved in LPS biosynthesis
MIVIDGDERSEYYHDYCKQSWEDIGVSVQKFSAVTPKDLPRQRELKFAQYSTSPKYVARNLKVEISPTERACFYSHFRLWQECVFLNEPILVLEHDTLLEKPENVWYEEEFGMICYDKAAMGSYVINPWFAKRLVEHMYSIEINNGPFAHIRRFAELEKIDHLYVNDVHPKYNPASNQVMSKKYGNTIQHFVNEKPELFNYKNHDFIIIP